MNKTILTSVRLSEQASEAVRKEAAKQERSVNWTINNVIEKFFGIKKEPKK